MAARVTLVTGPSGSGKTDYLLAQYRAQLANGPVGSALWLAPAQRNVAQLRSRLLGGELKACLQPHCFTFGQLADQVLTASRRPIRRVSRLQQREILRDLVRHAQKAVRLPFFGPIAHTPGFLDLLVHFIRQLKRLEIWPEAFEAAGGTFDRPRGSVAEKQRELASLYADYQEVLTRHDLYDAEGRFWSARFLLREGQTRPFERLRHVFVDGFTDFTRTEHEVLEIIAERVDDVSITLLLEPPPCRRELFAKAERTRGELERRHPDLVTIEKPRPAVVAWPALGHLEANIFRSPRSVPPAPPMTRVEILPAASQQAELEAVAARIKRLLVEGDPDFASSTVGPSQILVVLRSLQGAEEMIGGVFAEFGIPVAIEGGRSLGRSGQLMALTALLHLEFEDWPYRKLLQVLGSNYFRPAWPGCPISLARDEASGLVRTLQVPSGRKNFLTQAEQVSSSGNKVPAGIILLRRLGIALDGLPDRGTVRQWMAALQKLAADVHLIPSSERGAPRGSSRPWTADGSVDEDATAAWNAALAVFASSERLDAWLDASSRQLGRPEFLEFWQDMLQSEPLPETRDEAGRVRVLSATSARGLRADYLFLAGLSEQSFPAAQAGHGLLSEPEVAGLIAAGLPLPSRSEHNQDEMLLFYEVVSRPARRLTLSYAALDSSAQPLTPSPYLYELRQICGAALYPARDEPLQLSPLPPWESPLSLRDLRLMAVAQGQSGSPEHLAELLRRDNRPEGMTANLLAGLLMAEERGRKDQFGPFEGLVLGAAARQRLADLFPMDQSWNASQLEAYVSCPFEFFMNRVLRLKPLEDLELAVDYRARGTLMHGTLAMLHRRLNERAGGPAALASYDDEELLTAATEILNDACQSPPTDTPLRQALREIDRRLLTSLLAGYLQQHRKYDARISAAGNGLRPAHFEVAFGSEADSADGNGSAAGDPLSTPQPFSFDCGEETVLLSGRIDRIDVGNVDGTPVFNIVDYKSGSARKYSPNSVKLGHVLQLPLYTLAAAELLLADRQAAPLQAGYWFLKDAGYKDALACHEVSDGQVRPTRAWEAFRSQLAKWVLAAVRGIRTGHFPVASVDDKCTSTCPYNTVCRVNQVRVLEKVWQPPAEEQP